MIVSRLIRIRSGRAVTIGLTMLSWILTTYSHSPVLAAPRIGTIRLVSEPPGAKVVLMGDEVGVTPVDGLDVMEGQYSISLSLQGFESVSIDVFVKAGEVVEKTVRLVPLPSKEEKQEATPAPVEPARPAAQPTAAVVPTTGSPCERFRAIAGITPGVFWRLARLECSDAAAVATDAERARLKQALDSCPGISAAVKTLSAQGFYDRAYFVWDTFRRLVANLEAVTELPPPSPADATRFAREYQSLKKETAPGRRPNVKGLAARSAMSQARGTASWDPFMENALCETGLALFESLEAAQDWKTLRESVSPLAWLATYMGGSFDSKTMIALLDRTAREGYAATRHSWDDVASTQAPLAAKFAVAARAVALADMRAGLQSAIAKSRIVDAARCLADLKVLAPDDPNLPGLTAYVNALAQAERSKRIVAIQGPAKPADVRRVVSELDVLDRALAGPGAQLSDTERDYVFRMLDGFAGSGEEVAASTIPKLAGVSVDWVAATVAKARSWTEEWAIRQSAKLKTAKKYSEGVRVLRVATAALPGNTRIEALLSEMIDLDRRVRIEDVATAFKAGFPATGYVRALHDPRLTDEDRKIVLSEFSDAVATLKRRLEVVASLSGQDAFSREVVAMLDPDALRGRGWRVVSSAPSSDTLFPAAIRVRVVEIDNKPARIRDRETASQEYVSGTRMKENPDKKECERDLERARNSLRSLEAQAEAAEAQLRQCQARASSAGGWGGLIGGLACTAGDVTIGALVGKKRAEVSSIESKCWSMPDEIEVKTFAKKSYEIQHWAINASVRLSVELFDPSAGNAKVWSTNVMGVFNAEDRFVEAQPRYSIEGDPLQLPSPPEVEGLLRQDAAPKVADAVQAAARESWRLVAKTAPAGPAEIESLARLIIMAEESDMGGSELADRVNEARARLATLFGLEF